MVALASVQKRFIRLLPGLESMRYKEKLANLGCFLCGILWLEGDLIKVNKILSEIGGQVLSPQKWKINVKY